MAALAGRVVVASGNAGKVAELSRTLAPLSLELVTQDSLGVAEVAETGATFVENALIKARNAARHTGLPAIADDSGLEVAALSGAPGVHSARYSGEGDAGNNAKLLRALATVKQTERHARFYCALVLLRHAEDPTPVIALGSWRGRILHVARGEGGFGYDPLFWVDSHQCSAAELPRDEKNRISHRGRASIALLDALRYEDG
ncbi:RdgB/HAM1 family non-canonical purine NTP pyrophosphatase [Chromatocurvus halotolerans]|uniref:dITP/XTP pyrophosphatase n=1 Tax=Chromatocurvus halotolerans TaxID=1132028 RepID=A0A4R2KP49_9GAMM|nr:RdgB/HAM1 family non-canonical purine NTP pyrophosphatase [Chromatocurvus halotolerans]TCO75304.1 XTP/dITP diphosphohydrolase [Chromatocurvus halotolerans]